MRSFVATPPAPVVTWADADQHLKLSGDTSQQAEVEAMIAAATANLDGPDGWLGRALGRQTIEARFDRFDHCGLDLPYPPLVSIESVKYLDPTNVEQTIDAGQYDILGSRLVPAYQCRWPEPLRRHEAVRVRYVAGYETVPFPIRAAILLMVGDLYRFRETSLDGRATGIAQVPMSTTVERLLGPYRVFA
jgi:uncharacterized phiE125 gp8 family phage protein